ncbi:MAG: DNA polymerase I [bacterium]
MAKKLKLALIDAHALIHRAYHALPPMSTRDGLPTGAVYGFVMMLLKILTALKPTHVVAAFDMKGPTFRHKEFADYKAHRKEAAAELITQFDLVRDVLKAFNVPVMQRKGFEADDIIGTLVTEIDGEVDKIIVTGDLDALQLVDKSTSVFTLKRGVTDTVMYDEAAVRERFGFEPRLMVDYKGLRGDPSDNIPGLAGVGEKTAKELVVKYGSIEDIYKNLDKLSPRVRSRLKGKKKETLFSRKLATVRRDVKIEFNLDDAVMTDYDTAEVMALFERLELKSLMQRLPKSAKGEMQPTLFTRTSKERKCILQDNYHLVESKEDREDLKKRLAKEEIIAFDTETDWLGARQYPIVGMSFALRQAQGKQEARKVEAWYVPVTPETVKEWKKLLEDKKVGKTGHNLKYDAEVLTQSDINLKPIVFDSMIASYLLHPGARQHGLDTLAVQELGHHSIPITDLIGKKGKEQKKMSQVPLALLANYACEDAELAWRLYEILAPRIKDEGLTRVLEELELPLIAVLADMELCGVRLDVEVMMKLQNKVRRRLSMLKERIWKEASEKFNINSTQQLREILYKKLKLPTEGISRTQTGYSTAAAELEKLREAHPVIGSLEEYRELNKLLNTYIEALPALVDKETGRIYTSFNQTVTATGRLSSSDPNLQNIPVRTELGQEIRSAFTAERGNRLVKADYSQVELRLAAHLSRDEKLLDAFRAREDIHSSTAARVFGIDPKKVTDKQRRVAKTLNFGVLYGMGPQAFARAAGVSVEEARSFIGRYQDEYKGLTNYIGEVLEQAREMEFVETLFGRKRYVPEINARAPEVASAAARAAFNFPLQGTVADILKKAMIALHERLERDFPEAKMVLTVHDELVCEVPMDQAGKLARMMKEVMEGVYTLDVPLVADVAIGKNWQEMKESIGGG